MATLTADEITDIRMVIGDNNTPPKLSDTVVQAQYDFALTDAPNSSIVLPYTYVYCLRRLWGLHRLDADRKADYGDGEQQSQWSDHTKKLLDYWSGMAGLSSTGGGALLAGTLALAIDTTEDDE